jgi:bacterial/archaeal transporter family-2 protein
VTAVGRRAPGTAIAVVVGALFAVQSRINGELGARLHDGVAAALVSFGGGLVLLLAYTALSGRMRAGLRRVGAAVRVGRLRWWHLVGGVSGGYVVACQGLTVASLGVAVFTIALVGGQAASGLVVDRLGVGPAGPHPINAQRVAGAVVAVVAVLVTVSDRLSAPSALVLAVLPLLAGIGTSWQQAVIGQVGAAADGALPVALVNFVGGTTVLTMAGAVLAAIRGVPADWPSEPWLYAGGPLGILFIASAAVVVRWIGVLLLVLGTVAGQVLGALLLDVFVPAADDRLSAATVAGSVLALLAVAVTVAGRTERSARMGR